MPKKHLLLFCLLALAQGAYAQIEISSIEELQLIGNHADYPTTATYVLTQDIDASETANPDGPFGPNGFESIGTTSNRFLGTFDGRGYVISNYYSTRGGLFDWVGVGAVIRNVFVSEYEINTTSSNVGGLANRLAGGTVENCHVTGVFFSTELNSGGLIGVMQTSAGSNLVTSSTVVVDMTANRIVGGLVGSMEEGTIIWCSTAGTLTDTASEYAGGLVGRMIGNTVSESSSTMNIQGGFGAGGLIGSCEFSSLVERSYATGNITGSGSSRGGLIGEASNPITAIDSYSSGTVTGTSSIGGFAGSAISSVYFNCYSIGGVTGSSDPGGFLGLTASFSEITASYWNTETSGQSVGIGLNFGPSTVEGRTTAEMTFPYDANTFVGWDFDNVWAEDTTGTVNGGYPYLRWQTSADNFVTVTYDADSNGSISGDTSQTIRRGTNGAFVEAVPNLDAEFVQWSDGSTDNPRKDRIVDADLTVTAEFALISNVPDWSIID